VRCAVSWDGREAIETLWKVLLMHPSLLHNFWLEARKPPLGGLRKRP